MPQVSTLSTLKLFNEKAIRKALIGVDGLKHCGSLAEKAMISIVLKLTSSSVASLGGMYCIQLCYKSYKSKGRTGRIVTGQDLNPCPCLVTLHCTVAALSAPQTTLNLI